MTFSQMTGGDSLCRRHGVDIILSSRPSICVIQYTHIAASSGAVTLPVASQCQGKARKRREKAGQCWELETVQCRYKYASAAMPRCTCIPLCCGSTVPLPRVQQMIDRLVSFPYVDHRRSIGA